MQRWLRRISLALVLTASRKQRAAHRLSLSGYSIGHDISSFYDDVGNGSLGSRASSELSLVFVQAFTVSFLLMYLYNPFNFLEFVPGLYRQT